MRHTPLMAGAILIMTLVVSGCGSSSKSLTHAELVAKAAPVCERVDAKIAYYSTLTPASKEDLVSTSAVASAAPQIAALEQHALAELKKLTPPSELSSDWNELLSDVQSIAEDTAKVGEAAKAKSTSLPPSVIASATKTVQHLHTVATRDGLIACAKVT